MQQGLYITVSTDWNVWLKYRCTANTRCISFHRFAVLYLFSSNHLFIDRLSMKQASLLCSNIMSSVLYIYLMLYVRVNEVYFALYKIDIFKLERMNIFYVRINFVEWYIIDRSEILRSSDSSRFLDIIVGLISF